MVRFLFIVMLAVVSGLAGPASAQGRDTCGTELPAAGEQRIALVIANNDYAGGWQPLVSPQNDRVALRDALFKAGFATMELCNGSLDDLRKGLSAFSDRAKGADVALIYFAGHGIEWNGNGYAVPVDSTLNEALAQPATHLLPVDALNRAVADARVSILLLDACRTDVSAQSGQPAGSFANASAFRGFTGALGFAAAYDHPAFDSAPPLYSLSPFAQSVVQFLPIKGLELHDFFRAVQHDVKRRTSVFANGPQTPWSQINVDDPFYFNQPSNLASLIHSESSDEGAPLFVDFKDLEAGYEFEIATQALAEHGLEGIYAKAGNGDRNAQYLLSYMLRFGVGVTADPVLSRDFLERAAKADHPAALAILGFETQLYAEDEQQDRTGLEMLQRAAAQNFGRAWYFLGDIARAAESGDPYSAFLLADRGGDALDRSFFLLQGIAETGDDKAEAWLCELAMIHARAQQAAEACGFAAEAGFKGAQAHIADLIGRGTMRTGNNSALAHWRDLAVRTIFFELDRTSPRGLNQQIVLDGVVEELNRSEWRCLLVEGHSDQLPSHEYAIGLSERMAQSVVRKLVEAGIDGSKIVTIAWGKTRPTFKSFGIAPFNRRVELRVIQGGEAQPCHP